MVADNGKQMLSGKYDPNTIETVQNDCHTEEWERHRDSKELPTYQTKKEDIKQKSANHQRHLMKEHAGFRPDKSFTNQLLNLTQYIEDGNK